VEARAPGCRRLLVFERHFQSQVGEETLAGLCALRLRGPVEHMFVPLGVLALCLAPNATVILRDALRNTALLVVLAPFVIASRPLLPTSWARRGGRNSTGPPPSPT
jgi:hypothetical protein